VSLLTPGSDPFRSIESPPKIRLAPSLLIDLIIKHKVTEYRMITFAMIDSQIFLLVLPMNSLMSERKEPGLVVRVPFLIGLVPGEGGVATEDFSML